MSDDAPTDRPPLRVVDGGDEAHARDGVTLALERRLLAGLLLAPQALPEVRAVLARRDLLHPRYAAVWDAIGRLADAGADVTLPAVVDELDRSGALTRAGGAPAVAELADAQATGEYAVDHARRLRRRALEREERRVAARLAAGAGDEEDRAELRRLGEELATADAAPLTVEDVLLTGDQLRAVRERPQPESPLPGILDPEPHLHVLAGRPKSGKTTFALALARAWAQGVSPWLGAPALPCSRVLVVSREQPVARLDGVLRRLSLYADAGSIERLTDRVLLAARDPELPAAGRRLLTLDTEGLTALRGVLAEARRAGDPIGLVVLDSLSRLRPPELDENDNGAIAAWLDSLEAVATEEGAWTILVHHQGHASDPTRQEARSAGRGASAIAACAQVVMLLERGADDPRTRTLRVDGNALLQAEITYRVAGPEAEPGEILYWAPSDPLDAYAIEDLVAPSEELSTSALAWRVAELEPEPGQRPPGAAQRTAAALRERWARIGAVDAYIGPRSARMLRRRGPES